MEEFRKKTEKKVKVCAIVCCLFPITLILLKRFIPSTGDISDYSRGIVYGVCTGSVVVFLTYLIQSFTALHDEEKLKKMYINSTDERNIAVDRASASTTCIISAIVVALASIVAGFINETVSITLEAVLFLCVFIRLAVGAYYNKKM